MSFALYRQLAPPTAVEHGVFARFSGSGGPVSLVVARTSVLDVFEVLEPAAAADAADDAAAASVRPLSAAYCSSPVTHTHAHNTRAHTLHTHRVNHHLSDYNMCAPFSCMETRSRCTLPLSLDQPPQPSMQLSPPPQPSRAASPCMGQPRSSSSPLAMRAYQ